MGKFLKTTLIGGVIFLIPLVVVILVLGYAVQIAMGVLGPILSVVHIDDDGTIAGVGLRSLIAILSLVVVSFLAGLFARTAAGISMMAWAENSVLGRLPQFQMMKSMTSTLAPAWGSQQIKPGLLSSAGGWEICYVLEALPGGWTAIFLPRSPTPMSGTVKIVPSDKVERLDIPMVQVLVLLQRMGIGAGEVLSSVDLDNPRSGPAPNLA